MRRMVVYVCMAVLVFAVTSIAQTAAKPKSGTVEQELIKLENEWAGALVKHDWAFIDRILADDYMATDEHGDVRTKAQEIAPMKSEEFGLTSCVHHEMKVRVYGNAAVVTGRSTIHETYKGKDFSGTYRWTDTWVKSAGRWQCVAEHSSEIAQK